MHYQAPFAGACNHSTWSRVAMQGTSQTALTANRTPWLRTIHPWTCIQIAQLMTLTELFAPSVELEEQHFQWNRMCLCYHSSSRTIQFNPPSLASNDAKLVFCCC
uniref:Uncharacterized protein n=1 Tax=Oryza punctata TaxID=4537 RepID=A0A0E0M0B3_ORYPU